MLGFLIYKVSPIKNNDFLFTFAFVYSTSLLEVNNDFF